ncbi:hypothetical protein D9V32_01760 [Mycetocola tolaasinivorans]|uniref:Uncharacterized protein n=1 Tax=Mycetocola tolaasinivorans TaxID=76635 RepID=A0A3L7AC58_9MICO|nr:hypothetical protein [Mycetocola tolaasinivorans]RLP78076.1 hypothetical protein D9V32_01760 [Mycetocola tolaasinivorans]
MSTPENPAQPQPQDSAETGVWERLERAAEASPAVSAEAPRSPAEHPQTQGEPASSVGEEPRVFTGSTSAVRRIPTVGIFTLRELMFLITSAAVVLLSFAPVISIRQVRVSYTLWDLQFVPMPIAVGILPLVALLLVLLRRLVPRINWRVGTLSVDQFASITAVIASVSYIVFIGSYALLTAPGQLTWTLPFAAMFSLLMLFSSTFAPYLPLYRTEFAERGEVPADPTARPVIPIARRPRPQGAWGPHPAEGTAYPAGYAPAAAAPAPTHVAPYWVYSFSPRPVYAPDGSAVLFEMGPTAWVLAVEDRGHSLVLRADDGRIGILYDLSNLTRG